MREPSLVSLGLIVLTLALILNSLADRDRSKRMYRNDTFQLCIMLRHLGDEDLPQSCIKAGVKNITATTTIKEKTS